MPLLTPMHALDAENLNRALNGPGVYALYQQIAHRSEVIFYGGSLQSVRDRLRRLLSNGHHPCFRSATHFNCQPTTVEDVLALQASLLFEFGDENGHLPRCNDMGSLVMDSRAGASCSATVDQPTGRCCHSVREPERTVQEIVQRYAQAGIEPSLAEMMADPVVQAVMRRDRLTPSDVWDAIAHAREPRLSEEQETTIRLSGRGRPAMNAEPDERGVNQ